MNTQNIVDAYKAVHTKEMLSPELCRFLTHVLLRQQFYGGQELGDPQVPGALVVTSHDVIVETVLEALWNDVELVTQTELLPTYAYARLYTNGNVLKPHIDREACEVSATIQLGRSHHYSWPIFMGGNRYDLAEGDAVIYKGMEIEHWRNVCDGPPGYYSGQLFIHFVKKDGPYVEKANDNSVRRNSGLSTHSNLFVKHRPHAMYTK